MTDSPSAVAEFSPLRWQDGSLLLLDQTRLPAVETWLDCRTPEQVADAILMLVKNDYITGDTITIDGGLTSRIA